MESKIRLGKNKKGLYMTRQKMMDKQIEEALLKAEENIKKGKVKKATDVFREWEERYGI